MRQFTSLTLADQGPQVAIEQNLTYSLVGGAGDDYIRQGGSGLLNATIDGGAGNDTLDVRDMGIADLSQTTLTTSRQFTFGDSTLI